MEREDQRDTEPTQEEPGPQAREAARRREELTERLGAAEHRMVRAREQARESVWFGLGTFGLVGWSVAIPMLLGLALGIWIDSRYPSKFSWTLMLLFAGIITGCLNAWYWLSREREQIDRGRGDDDAE